MWPCAQQTSQWQRHGRYVPESNRHPGKMLPTIARRAIEFYTEPGDLVADPMCGIGTTLVEAIHLDRRAVGVELESRWAKLARANVTHAGRQGAQARAEVVRGNAGQLPRLLSTQAPDLLLTSPPYGNAALGDPNQGDGIVHARTTEGRQVSASDRARARNVSRSDHYGANTDNVAHLPYGRVDLVLSSPPYACDVGQLDKDAVARHEGLCQLRERNYRANRRNVGHARKHSYLEAMSGIYRACAAVLKPGGFLVLVTKDMRSGGALRNLAGDTVALCEAAGLLYWQHVIALLAPIRDGELVPRPSFWQRMQIRRALERGERAHLVCHEDVLVFRKPTDSAVPVAATSGAARQSRKAAA